MDFHIEQSLAGIFLKYSKLSLRQQEDIRAMVFGLNRPVLLPEEHECFSLVELKEDVMMLWTSRAEQLSLRNVIRSVLWFSSGHLYI